MSDNKALWTRVCMTDPKAVKPITGKQYSGNSPKPYWIVERLTDEFGPCGKGWGFDIVNERFERLTETDVLHVARVSFWHSGDRSTAFEQMGQTKAVYAKKDGSLLVDEDAPKKSVTDALVKCASYLGFAGDIFSGRWDDSKYVAEANAAYREKEKPANPQTTGSATRIAFENLPADWKDYLSAEAPVVADMCAKKGPQAAADYIKEMQLDEDQHAGLWSLLDSKTRSAINALTKGKMTA